MERRGPATPPPAAYTCLRLYRNNRDGTFTDVTKAAGLDSSFYGLGVAAGDFDNDGFVDLYVTGVGQEIAFFATPGAARSSDVTRQKRSFPAARSGFSTSALWFDYDRDGLLDLFVCNYVRWSPQGDLFCSADGTHKSYCTPEAYHGATCWLFHNRGNGTFEDVTARSGLFDNTSKSLGVAAFDYDNDGWPDLIVANDTQPNKLYRNQRDGTFAEVAVHAGVAFSEDGKARGGMGVDAADFDNAGAPSVVVTQPRSARCSPCIRALAEARSSTLPPPATSGALHASRSVLAVSSLTPIWMVISICWWSTVTLTT